MSGREAGTKLAPYNPPRSIRLTRHFHPKGFSVSASDQHIPDFVPPTTAEKAVFNAFVDAANAAIETASDWLARNQPELAIEAHALLRRGAALRIMVQSAPSTHARLEILTTDDCGDPVLFPLLFYKCEPTTMPVSHHSPQFAETVE
jgi:hypothetical protein